ncbi:hypothetical protein [Canibacter oris]|uniref:Uncharacterized protein n=1 Tax=Canibacter oris TaxID=1365628 RepID=A0A840DQD6_9MICO|nr:hypothetical protein [Canibacter oris]MBB4071406.1 hypothetical protein [Canibacter oris]
MHLSDAELLQLRDRVTAILEQHPEVVALTPLPAAGVVGQTIQVLKDFIGKPDNHLPQVSVAGGSLTVAAGLRVAATSPAPQLLDELAAAVRRELAAPDSAPETGSAAAATPALAAPTLNPADIQVQLVATSIDQTGGAA